MVHCGNCFLALLRSQDLLCCICALRSENLGFAGYSTLYFASLRCSLLLLCKYNITLKNMHWVSMVIRCDSTKSHRIIAQNLQDRFLTIFAHCSMLSRLPWLSTRVHHAHFRLYDTFAVQCLHGVPSTPVTFLATANETA